VTGPRGDARAMSVDNPRNSETARIVAHVAGFHATVANALAAGLPATGWGADEVSSYARQYLDLRERLRESDPALFGDLSTGGYSISIASRHSILRRLVLESHGAYW
jgi:hypothetical protein